MIDKSKYSSHGAFIKRLPASFLARRDKVPLATIHPQPQKIEKNKNNHNDQIKGVQVNSKTVMAQFRFLEQTDKKPIPQELTQPFLYIEKIMKKQTVDQKLAKMKKVRPFSTSKNVVKTKEKHNNVVAPENYSNLYEFQEDKRRVAQKIFRKLLESGISNLKELFLLRKDKKKMTPQIDVKMPEFVQFLQQIAPAKFTQKQLQHFFKLYQNKDQVAKPGEQSLSQKTISIKALSFNYQKFKRNETEVANPISEKAVRQRYALVKDYLIQFDNGYKELKQAMKSIEQYEESLRRHFKSLLNQYEDPHKEQLESLKRQLQKPIIKYDKYRKQQITNQIEKLSQEDSDYKLKLERQYESFIDAYQEAIRMNHDLFFTKRTINKLLLPLVRKHPFLTKDIVFQAIQEAQSKKQKYLECLSEFVIELEKDKKHLQEDSFTLEEVVQMVLMRHKKKDSHESQFDDEFCIYSLRKLTKEVKKQYILREGLIIQNIDEFPSDYEIPFALLSTCFEMECNKVLFKNQIWNDLLNLLPDEQQPISKYHRQTIAANLCLEFINRYFKKLDEKIDLQLKKSKQISLLAENASLPTFGKYGDIIKRVAEYLFDYNEEQDQDEAHDTVQPLESKKKVGFADVVDQSIFKENKPEEFRKVKENIEEEKKKEMVKSIIKSIFEQKPKGKKEELQELKELKKLHQQREADLDVSIADNLAFNTLAKSYFVPDASKPINTSFLDIRFYEKQKQIEEKNKNQETQFVRLGTSMLLSNVPNIEDLKNQDPLKISRFLQKNIDQSQKDHQKVVKERSFDSNVREGVDHNYYREKVKLENKPTVYDSDGKSKYSVLFPVGYYEGFVVNENSNDSQKWYLRPHHVETLTENPLSKKDNVIHTEYQSRLDKLPTKKRPDEFVIEQNVKRKEELIQTLQERINSLKNDLTNASRGSKAEGAKVPVTVLNNYLGKISDGKEDKQLQVAAYEGVLYDLRRKERELLNQFREGENHTSGEPDEKWWQRKDRLFNNQLRKDRLLVSDSLQVNPTRRQFVDKLKNRQIY